MPQSSPAEEAEREGQADLSRLRSRIAVLKARLEQSEKNVATLSGQLRRSELQLEISRREGELLSATRQDLAQRLIQVGSEREAAVQASERTRRALVARARLLYRFGRFGYFRVLLEPRDIRAFFDSVERLDSLARHDGRLLVRHREAKRSLEMKLEREQAVKAEIDRLYTRSRLEQRRIAFLKARREELLDRQRSESASRRREVFSLAEKAARLERLLETLARQSDDSVGPSGSMRPWKGVLDWPARGTIVETFGRHRHPKFDAWTFSNGIALELPEGTPVRAVYAGRAVYAQWLAEYGNLAILDHGDGVFTLYAWLQGLAVKPGSYVPIGSTVGWAGLGPGRREAGLYFEVRDRQKASDPVAWLR